MPVRAFTMLFSSLSPNTYIGILFSRHMIDAVRSTTASFFSTTSSIESSSYFFAAGLVFGSLSYTPSIAFAPTFVNDK